MGVIAGFHKLMFIESRPFSRRHYQLGGAADAMRWCARRIL